jgi:ubiquinone/menaquinone biosynthesis C-methylase UbiE
MTGRFDLADQARIDFALALRQQWARRVYPSLVEQVRQRGDSSTDSIRATRVYPWFGWLERNAQKQLWRAVSDAVRNEPPPADPGGDLGELDLDPTLELPAWYTDVDIHVQPEGIWSSDQAARVYELGAKLVMLGENDDYLFHQLFVDTAVPDVSCRRIVDLGCGFGKSTRPFKQRWPDADVIGVDLAAPVLRLAHRHAVAAGVPIRYLQRDARRTGLESASVDVVSATMLVHELPPEVLSEVLVEAGRVLSPGGVLRILDFQPTGDPIRDLAMIEHGKRNNEPYMPMLFATDVPELCRRAGLVDARWVAFDERGTGRLDTAAWPQRPEWHFPWSVLEARKPEENHE